MATTQPLLATPKTTMPGCKTLFFVITIVAIASSAAFLAPDLFKFSSLDSSSSAAFLAPDLFKFSSLDSSSPSHICIHAQDPETCLTMVSEAVPDGVTQLDTIDVLQKFLINYAHRMDNAMVTTKKIRYQINDHHDHGALDDCLELMDLSIDRVHDSIMALASSTTVSEHANAQAWLSAVLTNHVTCLDGLSVMGRKSIGAAMDGFISRAKVSLAMLAAVSSDPSNEEMFKPLKAKFPSWVTLADRKLLESSAMEVEADAVVAQDGTGNYKTVEEAVAAVPDKGKKRYVIYVKRGRYEENVEVTKKKKNLMIIGDGMDSTIITGSLNVDDGSTTFKSATLAAVGDGFILQDICIQNTAGPEKHQAVALRVGADQSVINRCRIDAYQDTLYAHSLRQFYRDCNITGTVDFIFGNAAMVIQNSKIAARKPMKNQKNMVTAQGRTDQNQNTGTSIQYCDIIASLDLEPVKSSYPTFLGRPWKNYSRTVVMESYIGDLIDPAGWAPWNGDFALSTLYYGEYMNRGRGAGTSKRVNWPGFHVITDPAEAMKFTVAELIQGGEWLTSTGVEFIEGL